MLLNEVYRIHFFLSNIYIAIIFAKSLLIAQY
jgi:hypothetical protein